MILVVGYVCVNECGILVIGGMFCLCAFYNI